MQKNVQKISIIIFMYLIFSGCGIKKPPLEPTQIVDGKSIIIPPEFDIIPTIEKTSKKEQ